MVAYYASFDCDSHLYLCVHFVYFNAAGLSKIIDTYTNILMENLDFDLVTPVMISKELLSEEEFTVIASDPCDYIKNSHLLEYVRVMDASAIFQFCLVLQEADNEMTYNIGNSIQRGTPIHCIQCTYIKAWLLYNH